MFYGKFTLEMMKSFAWLLMKSCLFFVGNLYEKWCPEFSTLTLAVTCPLYSDVFILKHRIYFRRQFRSPVRDSGLSLCFLLRWESSHLVRCFLSQGFFCGVNTCYETELLLFAWQCRDAAQHPVVMDSTDLKGGKSKLLLLRTLKKSNRRKWIIMPT